MRRRRLLSLLVGLALSVSADAARAQPATADAGSLPAEFQRLIDDYGRQWPMTDGTIDLTRLDRFYAADADVTIIDFAPPGISRGWAVHREALQRELFAHLIVSRYVPRQDVTVKAVGPEVVVTTFTFDYANRAKDGSEFTLVGRQTNVWHRRDGRWLIVHEHGSPVPPGQK